MSAAGSSSASLAVVGADGTLGRILTARLGARGVNVRCPDPRDDQPVAALSDVDVVVHAGGPRVRPGLGWADYFREHVGVTTTVVRSMRPGAHLVHLSSTAVFGARGEKVGPASREAPTAFPSAAYASAKLAAETAARALGAARGLEVTVLRPSMVYGPGVDSALSSIARLSTRGLSLRLSPASVRQHLVHIELLVRAVSQATLRPAVALPLLVADPFVLTNADLVPRGGGLPFALDLRAASAASEVLSRVAFGGSLTLDALAVLAIDNEFDVAPTFRALDFDPHDFRRGTTFDPYWESPS